MSSVSFPQYTAITSLEFSAEAVSIFCGVGDQSKKYLLHEMRVSKG